MSLVLHLHPLSSYCQKALVALYENETPFTPKMLDLMSAEGRAAHLELWPMGKMPVLVDDEARETIPEASIIIEYLAHRHPGKIALVPSDPDRAREARAQDRLFDLYVLDQVGKIVTDRFRPQGKNDEIGVENARATLATALRMIDQRMATRTWAIGDAFTIADCAAAPALFYANIIQPFATTHPNAAAYLGRLRERASYARAELEAKPYLSLMPSL